MYNIKITSVGQSPLEIIKEIKLAFGLGLKESKETVDTVEREGSVILPSVLDAKEANEIVKGLRARGATVEVTTEDPNDTDLLEIEDQSATTVDASATPIRIWIASIHETTITVDLAHKSSEHAKNVLLQLDISTINDKKVAEYGGDKKYNYMLAADSYESAMSIAIGKWNEKHLSNGN